MEQCLMKLIDFRKSGTLLLKILYGTSSIDCHGSYCHIGMLRNVVLVKSENKIHLLSLYT